MSCSPSCGSASSFICLVCFLSEARISEPWHPGNLGFGSSLSEAVPCIAESLASNTRHYQQSCPTCRKKSLAAVPWVWDGGGRSACYRASGSSDLCGLCLSVPPVSRQPHCICSSCTGCLLSTCCLAQAPETTDCQAVLYTSPNSDLREMLRTPSEGSASVHSKAGVEGTKHTSRAQRRPLWGSRKAQPNSRTAAPDELDQEHPAQGILLSYQREHLMGNPAF